MYVLINHLQGLLSLFHIDLCGSGIHFDVREHFIVQTNDLPHLLEVRHDLVKRPVDFLELFVLVTQVRPVHHDIRGHRLGGRVIEGRLGDRVAIVGAVAVSAGGVLSALELFPLDCVLGTGLGEEGFPLFRVFLYFLDFVFNAFQLDFELEASTIEYRFDRVVYLRLELATFIQR